MKIEIAAVADVDRVWPVIAKDIQAACIYSPEPITAGELWQKCRAGFAFLILVHDSERIWSASIVQFDGNALRVLCMTGTGMKAWFKDYYELVQQMAKDNGATRLLAKGRRGWLRLCGGRVNGDEYEVIL